jgi:protein transport protein SEC61 subunit alpha
MGPGGALYVPFNVALIVFFNYYYTFLQVRLN